MCFNWNSWEGSIFWMQALFWPQIFAVSFRLPWEINICNNKVMVLIHTWHIQTQSIGCKSSRLQSVVDDICRKWNCRIQISFYWIFKLNFFPNLMKVFGFSLIHGIFAQMCIIGRWIVWKEYFAWFFQLRSSFRYIQNKRLKSFCANSKLGWEYNIYHFGNIYKL